MALSAKTYCSEKNMQIHVKITYPLETFALDFHVADNFPALVCSHSTVHRQKEALLLYVPVSPLSTVSVLEFALVRFIHS